VTCRLARTGFSNIIAVAIMITTAATLNAHAETASKSAIVRAVEQVAKHARNIEGMSAEEAAVTAFLRLKLTALSAQTK